MAKNIRMASAGRILGFVEKSREFLNTLRNRPRARRGRVFRPTAARGNFAPFLPYSDRSREIRVIGAKQPRGSREKSMGVRLRARDFLNIIRGRPLIRESHTAPPPPDTRQPRFRIIPRRPVKSK